MHPRVPIVAYPCEPQPIQKFLHTGQPYNESPKDTQKQFQYVFITKDHTGFMQNKLNISTVHRIQIQKPQILSPLIYRPCQRARIDHEGATFILSNRAETLEPPFLHSFGLTPLPQLFSLPS